MLSWMKGEEIAGVTTYGDDTDPLLFYVIPNQPRYRIDKDGRPVFKFLKYRNAIPRPGGRVGGGFCVFDVELTVPEDQLQKVKDKLQERFPGQQVRIGTLTYTRGTASLQILDSGGSMVEKIRSPGSPSLFGKLITPVTIELSEEGVTLAEAALQGKGGLVQVSYDLWTPVRLPPVTATVTFNAEKFMKFHQEVNIDWSLYGDDEYRQTIEESFRHSEVASVVIDPGTVTDPRILNAVRDWAWNSLDDAIKSMVLGDLAPVSAEDRKLPDDIENLWRDVSQQKVASFQRIYREGQVMEWNPKPQGTLPNITTLVDKDGKPLEWEDFASVVNLDDDFFKTLEVAVRANADFASLPIFNVEVHLDYEQGSTHRIGDFAFDGPNEVEKFISPVVNNDWTYKYWYEVNYRGSARKFKSPELETDEKLLTINVDDTGVFWVDITSGDLNFDKADRPRVDKAQVTLRYEDEANGVEPIDQVFTLDSTHLTYRFTKAIFQPRRNPYHYQVRYYMADGKELQGALQEGRSRTLVINDPFAATKTVSIFPIGNLETEINTIDLDLRYEDQVNGYVQERSVRLSKNLPSLTWPFPVISETAGHVVYSGLIQLKDGTSEAIAETTATANTIFVGKMVDEVLNVVVRPNLVNWSEVQLVDVALRYVDTANRIDKTHTLSFDPPIPPAQTSPSQTWRIELKDATKTTYSWQATYYLKTPPDRQTVLATTGINSITLPRMPA